MAVATRGGLQSGRDALARDGCRLRKHRGFAGDFRDPLVGRDLLIGTAAGVASVFVAPLFVFFVPGWLGLPPDILPSNPANPILYGVHRVVSLLFNEISNSTLFGLAVLFLILLFRLVLRSEWGGALAVVLALSVADALPFQFFWINLVGAALGNLLAALVLIRLGLLAAIASSVWANLFWRLPVTGDLSAWYSGGGIAALAVLATITLFGFTASLGGRPALGEVALED